MVAKDFMWLIKVADIEHAGNDVALKEIGAEVFYQWLERHEKEPASYIIHLMRYLMDEYNSGYTIAKTFIDEKYQECFPGKEAVTSEAVMKQLEEF